MQQRPVSLKIISKIIKPLQDKENEEKTKQIISLSKAERVSVLIKHVWYESVEGEILSIKMFKHG